MDCLTSSLLPSLNQIATMLRALVDTKIQGYGLRGGIELDRRMAAEEVLAEMAQTRPKLHFEQRAIAAIRYWLRQNLPGFRSLALPDAEIIRDYILPACAFVERGGSVGGQRVEPSFSRSAMKSVDANIARGSEAMNKAILEKAAQHRAMHHAGLGWTSCGGMTSAGSPTSWRNVRPRTADTPRSYPAAGRHATDHCEGGGSAPDRGG